MSTKENPVGSIRPSRSMTEEGIVYLLPLIPVDWTRQLTGSDQKEINRQLINYAANEGITLAEAFERLKNEGEG